MILEMTVGGEIFPFSSPPLPSFPSVFPPVPPLLPMSPSLSCLSPPVFFHFLLPFFLPPLLNPAIGGPTEHTV